MLSTPLIKRLWRSLSWSIVIINAVKTLQTKIGLPIGHWWFRSVTYRIAVRLVATQLTFVNSFWMNGIICTKNEEAALTYLKWKNKQVKQLWSFEHWLYFLWQKTDIHIWQSTRVIFPNKNDEILEKLLISSKGVFVILLFFCYHVKEQVSSSLYE